MPGKVVRVLVRQGDPVEAGQPLVVLESMKMEQTLTAGMAGRVTRVLVEEGTVVQARALLVELAPEA
jgi:biotin carboxyl carrier protein